MQRFEPRPALTFSALVIDYDANTVSQHGEKITLRPKEFELLYTLALNHDIVLSLDQIDEALGSRYVDNSPNSIHHTISRIRAAIGKTSIETVARRGYVLRSTHA